MKSILELDDKEIRQAYVSACRRAKEANKEKKDIEEEMCRRFEKELEENRV